jgi:hypothetical protein
LKKIKIIKTRLNIISVLPRSAVIEPKIETYNHLQAVYTFFDRARCQEIVSNSLMLLLGDWK